MSARNAAVVKKATARKATTKAKQTPAKKATARKAPRKGITPVQTEEQRQLRRMQRMTDAQLITLALQCMKGQEKLKEEYDQICEILGGRFPHEKTEEAIITPTGAAFRKERSTFVVEEDRIDDLKASMGKDFDECFTEKKDYILMKDKVVPLYLHLGSDADTYMREKIDYVTTPHFRKRFTDPLSVLPKLLDGMLTRETKVSITVKPAA